MREDTTVPIPEDPYGIAKYAVELDLKAAQEMFGLEYTIFRPHNVYGVRQNLGDPYRNVIGIFMNQVMNDKPITIFGDGLQTRAFSNINDVAPIIARSVHEPFTKNQIYNVGADELCTVNELALMVETAMGRHTSNIIHLPERKEVYQAFADHLKMRKYFGWVPSIHLRDGLEEMARWAKVAGARRSRPFAGSIELDKNMPESWRDLC
jgi:UDP-glucose 4-epimerase